MSKDVNKCIFIGRVGKDIELKYTPAGSAVANFSIACGDDYKGKDGQKVEQTNWINIVMFGKLAEITGQYVSKGSQIYVEGKQVTRKWQDQSGADRYTTEIVASEMQMLGGRNEGGQSAAPQQRPQASAPPPVDDFETDEIPF